MVQADVSARPAVPGDESAIAQIQIAAWRSWMGDAADVLPIGEAAAKRAPETQKPGLPAGLTLRDLEQQYILQTLGSVNGNRTQAARLLGISLRCLQYKLKAYRHAEALERPDGSPAGSSRIVPPGGARRHVSSLDDVLSVGDRRRMLMS